MTIKHSSVVAVGSVAGYALQFNAKKGDGSRSADHAGGSRGRLAGSRVRDSGTGSRPTCRGLPRPVGCPARPSSDGARCLLRPGFRHRPGSTVAYGLRPPSRAWALGGVRGRTRARRGPADAYVRRRVCGQGRLLGVERCRQGDAGRLCGGRERVHRDDEIAARRVPPRGRDSGDLAAVALARRLQGPQHADGSLRGEALAGTAGACLGGGTGRGPIPKLP